MTCLSPSKPTPGASPAASTAPEFGQGPARDDSPAAVFGRLGVYVGLVVSAWILLRILVGLVIPSSESGFSRPALFFSEAAGALAVFLPIPLLSRLERRRAGEYGLPASSGSGALLAQGALAGSAEAAALMGLIALCGGYSFGPVAIHGLDLLKWFAFWLAFFVLVGVSEEFLFRGYAQYTLARGVGFWPAAFVLSLAFGVFHLWNEGENWAGATSVFCYGLLMCLSLRRTGSLWFAVAAHAAFDFGETFLFSVPNSGFVFEGHLSGAALHGPDWLTGGSVGPEGSVFCFAVMGAMACAIHFIYPAKRAMPGAQSQNAQ